MIKVIQNTKTIIKILHQTRH